MCSVRARSASHVIGLVESKLVCKQMWELAEVSWLGCSKVSSLSSACSGTNCDNWQSRWNGDKDGRGAPLFSPVLGHLYKQSDVLAGIKVLVTGTGSISFDNF